MFNIGDLIEGIPRDADAKKLGVVVGIGGLGSVVKVCWAGNYGTFWANPEELKLIARGKRNV